MWFSKIQRAYAPLVCCLGLPQLFVCRGGAGCALWVCAGLFGSWVSCYDAWWIAFVSGTSQTWYRKKRKQQLTFSNNSLFGFLVTSEFPEVYFVIGFCFSNNLVMVNLREDQIAINNLAQHFLENTLRLQMRGRQRLEFSFSFSRFRLGTR